MNALRTAWLGTRAALFYAGYGLLMAWFVPTALLLALPFGRRFGAAYLHYWNHATLRWLRLCCGVRWQVEGLEHLPAGPCVLLAKHQSEWETYFLPLLKQPACSVLKRELLAIPVFGWGVRLSQPIAIDRGHPRIALKQIQEQGLARLADGISVVIYPEGTRIPVGQTGRYARSGASLAIAAGVPVVAIAHNAGHCWPSHSFLKFAGTIRVRISEPFDTRNQDSRTLTDAVQAWIESHVAQLP